MERPQNIEDNYQLSQEEFDDAIRALIISFMRSGAEILSAREKGFRVDPFGLARQFAHTGYHPDTLRKLFFDPRTYPVIEREYERFYQFHPAPVTKLNIKKIIILLRDNLDRIQKEQSSL